MEINHKVEVPRPMSIVDDEGNEIVRLVPNSEYNGRNSRYTNLGDAFRAVRRAYRTGRIGAGQYRNHTEGLVTRGLPKIVVHNSEQQVLDEKLVEAMLDGTRTRRVDVLPHDLRRDLGVENDT